MKYVKDDSYYRCSIYGLNVTLRIILMTLKMKKYSLFSENENNLQRILYFGEVILKINISGPIQILGNLNISNLKIRMWMLIWKYLSKGFRQDTIISFFMLLWLNFQMQCLSLSIANYLKYFTNFMRNTSLYNL